jgi:hypothetical protein
MRTFVAIVVTSVLLCVGVEAQTKEATGVITGRVLIGDKPAPGLSVALMSSQPPLPSQLNRLREPAPRVTTDEDGRFRFTGVVAGQYNVIPLAPLYSAPIETRFGLPGKRVSIADGEIIEGIDFTLTRGGVITGRITDSDGRPIINERVNLAVIDERGQSRPFSVFNPLTDDRGIYRIFGLPEGRYKISAGNVDSEVRIYNPLGSYRRTFHPDTTEEARATIIEVTAGSETKGIDITLSRPGKTYEISGRVVDDSGKPLSGMRCVFRSTGNSRVGSITGLPTGPEGEFRFGNVPPGQYTVYAISGGENNVYGEPVLFEVKDESVTGLEVRARSASIISGVVIVEGTADQAFARKLPQLEFTGSMTSEGSMTLQLPSFKIGEDGSFRIPGVQPGKVEISLNTYYSPKGFSFVRLERGGIEQREIEVEPGSNITDLRIVLAYGTSLIRGQIKVEGGTLPAGMRAFVAFRRVNGDRRQFMPTEVDVRGRFTLEGLPAGDYELTLSARGIPTPGSTAPPPTLTTKKIVTVANDSTTEVTLTINLSGKGEE